MPLSCPNYVELSLHLSGFLAAVSPELALFHSYLHPDVAVGPHRAWVALNRFRRVEDSVMGFFLSVFFLDRE